MSYVIIGLAIVATWHFVYEYVLAPLFRFEARADACELRQAMPLVIKRHASEMTDAQRRLFKNSVTSLDAMIARFELTVLWRFYGRLHADPEFRASVDKSTRQMTDCKIPELQKLDCQAEQLAMRALSINSAGWLIWVIPIGVTFALVGKVQRGIRKILFAPEPELHKVAPELCEA